GTRVKILALDMGRPAPAAPLFAQDEDNGYVMGLRSPDGRRLAYLRTGAKGTVAGTVDLVTGVRADLPLSVDFDFLHAPWVNGHSLIVNALPADQPAPDLNRMVTPQETTA